MADQSSETVEANGPAITTDNNETMKGRKMSWANLRRFDSLNMEAGRVSFTSTHANPSQASWGRTLSLAFQCLGVIYGDVGTSPLYVCSSTFTDGIKENQDLLGVPSLIICTILLSPLIKYAFIVLRASDSGNGNLGVYLITIGNLGVYLITIATVVGSKNDEGVLDERGEEYGIHNQG